MTFENSVSGLLNESQERHLLASCQYIDSLLSEVESVLSASESTSAFPKYKNDLTLVQAKISRDHIARIRRQVLESLNGVGIEPPTPRFGAIHSIRVSLTFADIAIEECTPSRMRGYGELREGANPILDGMVEEIKGSIHKLVAFLSQGSGQDFQARLDRLQKSSDRASTVRTLERIVDRHGLLEFRPALASILDRMENGALEIAFFGRVSSGKSSLLNHVLKTDILPIGVTPVTAVPTRMQWGDTPALDIFYAHKDPETLPVEHLPEFVTEGGNQSNHRHITRLTLRLPAPALKNGIVLVDTPGLGSLASSGTAEALSYLPRCDLGVVLIDSASTLTENDLATIRALEQAAIPVNVVLSKADLLTSEDLTRSIDYTTAHLARELGHKLTVRAVSSVGRYGALLDRWFDEEITPLFRRQRELAAESLRRKIGVMMDQLRVSLNARLRRSGSQTADEARSTRDARLALQNATGKFESARADCLKAVDQISISSRQVLEELSDDAVQTLRKDRADALDGVWLSGALSRKAASEASKIAETLKDLARDAAAGLQLVASSIRLSGAPSEDDFLALLTEMPILDPGTIDIDLRRGFLARSFPALARHQIHRKLEAQIGQQIRYAYSSFQTLMVSWIRRCLNELRSRFESSAEVYRALLTSKGAGGAAEDVSDVGNESIQQDLKEIQILQDAS